MPNFYKHKYSQIVLIMFVLNFYVEVKYKKMYKFYVTC